MENKETAKEQEAIDTMAWSMLEALGTALRRAPAALEAVVENGPDTMTVFWTTIGKLRLIEMAILSGLARDTGLSAEKVAALRSMAEDSLLADRILSGMLTEEEAKVFFPCSNFREILHEGKKAVGSDHGKQLRALEQSLARVFKK